MKGVSSGCNSKILSLISSLSILVSKSLVSNISRAEDGHIEILTLDEFIKQTCEKDTVFQEILIDELALKYKRAIALPAKDLVLSVKNQNNFQILRDHASTRKELSTPDNQ